jgi:aminoglycoside phosphotransferase (APT) family kinase protein
MSELIGAGRHADVFAAGPGRVLRRYRTGQDATMEAAAMAHARAHDYPVPEVFDADGSDIVMERVEGPSMLDYVARRPAHLLSCGELLADLHHRLHAIPALDALERPFGESDSDVLLHLDLQPANIVMTKDGPVVLDWGFAAAGPPDAENAHTWLQLVTSEVPGSRLTRTAAAVGRTALVRALIRHFDRARLEALLPQVARYRLERRVLTDKERAAINAFVGRRRR